MKVSVIIPVYNTEHYLPRCIDSILNQSFTDFELLLIDDGSTDSSGAICDAYAEMDGRVRAFHKENGGVSSARNLGLDNAQGEWVCFVDSDDELFKDGLQTMEEGVDAENDMVMAGYEIFDSAGSLSYAINARNIKIISAFDGAMEMYRPMDYKFQGYICSKLFKNSIIKKQHLYFDEDLVYSEDRLFIAQYICRIEGKIYYTTIPVYKYFERQTSAMGALQRSFNKGVVTDLDARIGMYRIFDKRFGDKELECLMSFDVYRGYRRIVGFMQDFDYKGKRINYCLRRKCICTIGVCSYLSFERQRNSRRIKKKIRDLLGKSKE